MTSVIFYIRSFQTITNGYILQTNLFLLIAANNPKLYAFMFILFINYGIHNNIIVINLILYKTRYLKLILISDKVGTVFTLL